MKVFLSCVSSEFRSYRLKLANQLGVRLTQEHVRTAAIAAQVFEWS
jgi:hypothetical protein